MNIHTPISRAKRRKARKEKTPNHLSYVKGVNALNRILMARTPNPTMM
jgi:hypothetical protein